MALQIDVISDVVCRWSFVGKRKLEAALALYRQKKPQAHDPDILLQAMLQAEEEAQA